MEDELNTVVSYDKGNKYERASMRAINHKLLKSEGLFSLDFTYPEHLNPSAEVLAEMRRLIDECNHKYQDWGFKDPRTCFDYEVWASALPEHKIIAIHRSPEEVWLHYQRGSRKRLLSSLLNFPKRWCEHNEKILGYLEKAKVPFLVLNYEQFMTDPDEFKRLEKFVGHKLKDERDMTLYRNRSKNKNFMYCLMKFLAALHKKKAAEKIRQQFDQYRRS